MNAIVFESLPEDLMLTTLRDALKVADPTDVILSSDSYRNIAKLVHPDRHPMHETLAREAFQLLNDLQNAPVKRMLALPYAPKQKLGSGDIADTYLIDFDDGSPAVLKIAREDSDNDLMMAEARALNHIQRNSSYDTKEHFLPHVLMSGVEQGHAFNVLAYDPMISTSPLDYFPLTQFGQELDHKAVGWLWNRIVSGLMVAQDEGYIHGAITPDNLLVDPATHSVVIIDWVHASQNQSPIMTMSEDWDIIYPPEIRNKLAPLPSTDIYMAARSVLWATMNNPLPAPMLRYFAWCINDIFGQRPNDLKLLLEQWENVLFGELAWKREFILFQNAPIRVDWNWFA